LTFPARSLQAWSQSIAALAFGPKLARMRWELQWMGMALGYRYKLERQENGWWLVRFPDIPEALTEGETEEEARVNAVDCVIAALDGYVKAGRSLP
jgi:predicted RNase H-like HicB family nuclease